MLAYHENIYLQNFDFCLIEKDFIAILFYKADKLRQFNFQIQYFIRRVLMKIANQFDQFQRKKNGKKHQYMQENSKNLKNKSSIQSTNKFSSQNMSSQKFQLERQPIAGSLQNGEITQFYFQKLIHIQYQLCLVIFLNMFLVIISSSISFPQLKQQDVVTYKGCLYFGFVCFIIQCFLLSFRMITVLELQKQQKILYQKSSIFSSKKIFTFFAECFIMFIQPYPFFQNINISTQNSYQNIPFTLPLNDLLTAISVLRIYIFIRAGLILTPYRNTRSNRLCKMYGCKADFSFSLKCMFKDNPMVLIAIFFTISSMIFAFQIYLVERRAALLSQIGLGMANNYMNALWLVLMTITTVGYGDYYPHTAIGRIIILIVAIWGTFIVSMMVVVVSNTLTMQKNEKRTSIIINKLQLRYQIQKQAEKLVSYFILKKHLQNKLKKIKLMYQQAQNSVEKQKLQKEKTEKQKNLKNYSYQCNRLEKSFSKLRKQIKTGEDIQDIQDEVSSHFLHVNSDIQILNKNQEKIIEFIHEYLQFNGNKAGQQVSFKPNQNRNQQNDDQNDQISQKEKCKQNEKQDKMKDKYEEQGSQKQEQYSQTRNYQIGNG